MIFETHHPRNVTEVAIAALRWKMKLHYIRRRIAAEGIDPYTLYRWTLNQYRHRCTNYDSALKEGNRKKLQWEVELKFHDRFPTARKVIERISELPPKEILRLTRN